MYKVLFAMFFIVFGNVVFAQDTLYCNYTYQCGNNEFGDWLIDCSETNFNLAFLADLEGNFYIIGNNGSEKVGFLGGEEKGSFVEITMSENLSITTVDFNTGKSIHSRNMFIDDLFSASQYYGFCEMK